jgi:hypothetical protein
MALIPTLDGVVLEVHILCEPMHQQEVVIEPVRINYGRPLSGPQRVRIPHAGTPVEARIGSLVSFDAFPLSEPGLWEAEGHSVRSRPDDDAECDDDDTELDP